MSLKLQFTHILKRGYDVAFTEMADPRTNNNYFISNPFSIGSIMIIYLLTVGIIGPRWMRTREAFEVEKIVQVHNIFQILVGLVYFYQGLNYWLNDYDSMCGSVQRYSQLSLQQADYVYFQFIFRLLALTHTVLLVLGKKQRNMFWHIIDDCILVGISWCCAKYYPESHCVFLAFINGTVGLMAHFIYLLVEGIVYYDQYWIWTKRVNAIKMVQYQIIILHFIEVYLYGCEYGKLHLFVVIPLVFFITNAYLNYNHENKIDEFFNLLKEEPAPKNISNKGNKGSESNKNK